MCQLLILYIIILDTYVCVWFAESYFFLESKKSHIYFHLVSNYQLQKLHVSLSEIFFQFQWFNLIKDWLIVYNICTTREYRFFVATIFLFPNR